MIRCQKNGRKPIPTLICTFGYFSVVRPAGPVTLTGQTAVRYYHPQ